MAKIIKRFNVTNQNDLSRINDYSHLKIGDWTKIDHSAETEEGKRCINHMSSILYHLEEAKNGLL